jgi:hypothetical protein
MLDNSKSGSNTQYFTMRIRHFRTRGSSSSEFATLGSLKQAHPTHGYLQDAAVYEVPFCQRAQVVTPQIQRISST